MATSKKANKTRLPRLYVIVPRGPLPEHYHLDVGTDVWRTREEAEEERTRFSTTSKDERVVEYAPKNK